MVLFALVAVETPNALPTERIAFAYALHDANYEYGGSAHTFRISFVAGLDEAREYLSREHPDFPEDPKYTFEDHVQHWANIAADRDAAAARILSDVQAAAAKAGVRSWTVDVQIADEPWICFSSDG